MRSEILDPLIPLTLPTLLTELGQISNPKKRPEITVMLTTGGAFTGVLAKREIPEQPADAGFQLLMHLSNSQGSVAYFSESQVASLVVHDAVNHRELLSLGEIEENSTPAETTLNIKRRARAFSEKLESQFGKTIQVELPWETLRSDEAARRSVVATLVALEAALEGVVQTYSDQEVAESLDSITMRQEESPSVAAAQGRVEICCNFGKGKRGRFSREELEAELKAIL